MTIKEVIEKMRKTVGVMRSTSLGTNRMRVALTWAVIDNETGRLQTTHHRLADALDAADELTLHEEAQDKLRELKAKKVQP